MEADLAGNQGAAPVAEPTETGAQHAATEAGAGESGDWLGGGETEESSSMNDVIRSVAATGQRPASKPAEPSASGESAPEGASKPGDAPRQRGADGRFLSRRGAAEAVRTAEQRIADLERQLAERDPAKIREEIAREQAQQAEAAKLDELAKTQRDNVARYRRLLEVPDAKLSAEDYQFREDFKERLAEFPEVSALNDEVVRQRAAEEIGRYEADIRSQIGRVASREGIDPERWKQPGTTWERMTADACDAREARVKAPLEARIRALEDENRQLKLTGPRGLGTGRVPIGAGRSGAGQDDNDWFRRAALG